MRPDPSGALRRTIVYNPKELAELPRYAVSSTPPAIGEIAARCYELFEQGRSVREIVIELREQPHKIRELREMWLDDGGADVVISPAAKLSIEKIVGEFSNVAELLDLITELKARQRLKDSDET